MKIFLIIILFTFSVSAQITVSQEFLDDSAKAFALVVSQRDQIAKMEAQITDLQKLVKEVEKANLTPCAISMNAVKADLVFWTDKLNGTAKDKEILKILKDVRKQGRKSVANQCGISSQSDFMKFLDVASRFAPLLLLLR
jgi:hypothetical protein